MTENAWIRLLSEQTLLFSAAVLLLALLRPVLRRLLDAGAVYLAWLLVPLMLLSPALPRLLEGQVLPASVQTLELSWLGASRGQAPGQTAKASQPPLSASTSPRRTPSSTLVLGLWCLGAGGLLLVLVRRQRRFTRGLRRLDRAWQAPAGESPALMGLWQARIVLPQDFEQRFSARERALILAHEQVHARRHDNAWNLLAAGLLVLQWFNPLAWWALRAMRLDQELACDAAVLNQSHPDNPGEEPLVKSYVNALLKSHPQRALPVLSTGWAHRHPLLARVKGLRQHRRPAWQRVLGRCLAMGLCAGVTVLAQATQPSPTDEARQTTERLLDQLQKEEHSHGAKTLAVLVQLNSQQGQLAWQQREFATVYSLHQPLDTYRQLYMSMPMGSWCLSVHLYQHPDGEVRTQGEVMDKTC
ncbi:MAG TPA: M56 family metallopeptidase, partial [Burkholderiaceae bacterium]|nr:M56 family metallopeptidase [Burkholderiaceae bacterium]